MEQEKRYFLGITNDGELYSVNISPKTEEHRYFSMTGQTDRPLTYDEAVQRTREHLEDGELWKMVVEAGATKLGLDDWVDFVIDTDGETCGIDNSCLPDEHEDNDGITWIFEASSGGQHQEEKLATYFVSPQLFQDTMAMWDAYHMKEENPPELESIMQRLDKSAPDTAEALSLAVEYVKEIEA